MASKSGNPDSSPLPMTLGLSKQKPGTSRRLCNLHKFSANSSEPTDRGTHEVSNCITSDGSFVYSLDGQWNVEERQKPVLSPVVACVQSRRGQETGRDLKRQKGANRGPKRIYSLRKFDSKSSDRCQIFAFAQNLKMRQVRVVSKLTARWLCCFHSGPEAHASAALWQPVPFRQVLMCSRGGSGSPLGS